MVGSKWEVQYQNAQQISSVNKKKTTVTAHQKFLY